jgi:shikimate dehydrogenase
MPNPKKLIKAAVIGDPINHSLSPIIHQFWLRKYKIEGTYIPLRVKSTELIKCTKELIKMDFAGFNVTIPHKEEIFKICDHTSNSARLTKAFKNLIIIQNQKIFGNNSDVEVFLKNLEQTYPDFFLKNKTAFVIGAGGAARAVIYGLIKSGIKNIFITNRNLKRGEDLAADFANFNDVLIQITNLKDFENNLNKCDLLVNTTSLGMINCEKLIINLDKLPISAIVYDIVYRPLITDLLAIAKQRGNRIVTGIGMLLNQATIGFEAWFKQKADINEELIKELLN